MKKVLLVILVTLSSNVYADGPRPKPGLWELTIVKQLVDGRDMQAQMAAAQAQKQQAMANMTPEQRKQMEGRMGQGAHGAGAGNMRICISKEMAERDKPAMDPQSHCETSKLIRSGNKVSFEFNCSNNGRTQSGKGETTISSDSMESVMDMTMTDARGSHTLHNETRMKFIGADCQGIKPADQISSEIRSGRR